MLSIIFNSIFRVDINCIKTDEFDRLERMLPKLMNKTLDKNGNPSEKFKKFLQEDNESFLIERFGNRYNELSEDTKR